MRSGSKLNTRACQGLRRFFSLLWSVPEANVQKFRQSLVPRWIWTTGWSAGLWTRQPAVSAGGPGGQRRPRFAPYLCGTSAPPAAAASSTRISAHGGPSRLMPGASGPLWDTAGKRRGWPVSRSPGAGKAKRAHLSKTIQMHVTHTHIKN